MTMIRTLLLSALTTAAVSLGTATAFAQTPTDPEAPQELTSQLGSVAVLRGLDKVTARTRDFEAPIGEETPYFHREALSFRI